MQTRDTVIIKTKDSAALVRVAADFLYFAQVQSAIHAEDQSADGLRPEIAARLKRARSLFIPLLIDVPASLQRESTSDETSELDQGEIAENGRFWDSCNVQFRRNPIFADFRPAVVSGEVAIMEGVIEGAQTLLQLDTLRETGDSSAPWDDIFRPIGASHVRPDNMAAIGVRINSSLQRIVDAVRNLWKPAEQLSRLRRTRVNGFRESLPAEMQARQVLRPFFVSFDSELIFPDEDKKEKGTMIAILREAMALTNKVTRSNMDTIFNQNETGSRPALYDLIDLVIKLDNLAKTILPFIDFRGEETMRELVAKSRGTGVGIDYATTLDPDSEFPGQQLRRENQRYAEEELEAMRNALVRPRIAEFFVKYDSVIRQMADIIDGNDEPLEGDTEEEYEQEQAVVAVNDVMWKTLAVAGGIAFGVTQGIGGPETMLATTIIGSTLYTNRDWLTYLSNQLSKRLGISTFQLFGRGAFSDFSPAIVSKILVLKRRAMWLGAITLLGTAVLYAYDGTPVVEAVMVATTKTVANYYTDIVAYMIATVGAGYFELTSVGQSIQRFLDRRPLGWFTPSLRTLAIYGGGLAVSMTMTWYATSLLNGDVAMVTQSTGFITPLAVFLNKYLSINMQNIQGAWAGPWFTKAIAQATMGQLFGTATASGTAAFLSGYIGNETVANVLAGALHPLLKLLAFFSSSMIDLASTMLGLLTVAVSVWSRVILTSQEKITTDLNSWERECVKLPSLQNPNASFTFSQLSKVVPARCINNAGLYTGNYAANIQFGSKDGVLTTAYEKIRATIGPQIRGLPPAKFTDIFGKLGYSSQAQAINHYSMLLTQQCDEPVVAATLEGRDTMFTNLIRTSPTTITELFNKGSQLFDSRKVKIEVPPQANNSSYFETAETIYAKNPIAMYYSKAAMKALNAQSFSDKWFNDKFMPAERLLYQGSDLREASFKKTITNYVAKASKVIGSFTTPDFTLSSMGESIVKKFVRLLFGIGGGFIDLVVFAGGKEVIEFTAVRTAALLGHASTEEMDEFFRLNGYLPDGAASYTKMIFGTISFGFYALTAAAVVGTGRFLKGVVTSVFTATGRVFDFLSGWSGTRAVARTGTQGGAQITDIVQPQRRPRVFGNQGSRLNRQLSGSRDDANSQALGDETFKRTLPEGEEEEVESETSSQTTKRTRILEEESTQSGTSYSVEAAGAAVLVKIMSDLPRYLAVEADKFGYLLSGLGHSEYLRNHILHVIGRLKEPELIDFNRIKHMRISDQPLPALQLPADVHLVKFGPGIVDQDDAKALKAYIDDMMTGLNTRQPASDTWLSVLDLLVIASTYTVLMST